MITQLINNATNNTKNTVSKCIFDIIKSKYYIEYYPDIYLNCEKDNNGYFEMTWESSYSFMLYSIFHKKYPRNFRKIITNLDTIYIATPDAGLYYIEYKNHIIMCNCYYDKPNTDVSKTVGNNAQFASKYCIKISVIGKYAPMLFENLERYFDRVKDIIYDKNSKHNKLLQVLTVGSENDDRFMQYIPVKNINNIVMNIENKNKLCDILDRFMKSESINYISLGIKKKIGILLYGPPGTGKSSTAYSIAQYTGMRVIKINPNEVIRVSVDILNGKSVFLFEEIDSFINDTGANTQNIILRRDQLLDYIDNIPTNSIIIATTNYIDRLDEALIRPGRFDLKIHMDLFSREDTEEFLSKSEYDLSYMLDWYEYPVVPSKVQFDLSQEVLKKSLLENGGNVQ